MSDCEKPLGRVKLGEIFYIENNGFEFTCGHCLYDFKQLTDFVAHIQEYLEEMIMYQRPIEVESDSGSEPPIENGNGMDGDPAPQLMVDDVSEFFENDSQESRDNDDSDVELVSESKAANETVDDVVYVLIGDDDKPDSGNAAVDIDEYEYLKTEIQNEPEDDEVDDEMENEYAAFDDDYENAEIENEPDDDGTRPPLDGGYKCPLCKSCYSTIEFLQMHLSNYHSKSTIYNYLAVATTNNSTSSIMSRINLSKRIEDLPSENIFLEEAPETVEYAKYLFGFQFEKVAPGLCKCPKCEFTGLSFKVKNHVFTHLKKKLFHCMICQQKFNTLARIRLHMRKTHLCTWIIRRRGVFVPIDNYVECKKR